MKEKATLHNITIKSYLPYVKKYESEGLFQCDKNLIPVQFLRVVSVYLYQYIEQMYMYWVSDIFPLHLGSKGDAVMLLWLCVTVYRDSVHIPICDIVK